MGLFLIPDSVLFFPVKEVWCSIRECHTPHLVGSRWCNYSGHAGVSFRCKDALGLGKYTFLKGMRCLTCCRNLRDIKIIRYWLQQNHNVITHHHIIFCNITLLSLCKNDVCNMLPLSTGLHPYFCNHVCLTEMPVVSQMR